MGPSGLASSTNACSMGNALSKPVFLLGAALPDVHLCYRIALPVLLTSARLDSAYLSKAGKSMQLSRG